MYNEEMSLEEFEHLCEGDEITLREENDFISQYGEYWKELIPMGWNSSMDCLFGKTLRVTEKTEYAVLVHGNGWCYSRQMLKGGIFPTREEVISLFETMILGNN